MGPDAIKLGNICFQVRQELLSQIVTTALAHFVFFCVSENE